ncbi:MAG: hypothetical protein MUF58_14350 [Arcicella sp.]|jgi:hypothetical protein|nr:hypothetical protein [Arcicella sp.]
MDKNQELSEIEIDDIPLLESREPNEKDKFYLNWGLELLKNQFNLANELLKQQISICITLLGVSVVFDKLFDNNPKLKFLVVFIFFLSLISAFIGLMPFDRKVVWLDSPDDIEKFQRDALHYKKCWYYTSGVFIALGILCIIYHIFITAF